MTDDTTRDDTLDIPTETPEIHDEAALAETVAAVEESQEAAEPESHAQEDTTEEPAESHSEVDEALVAEGEEWGTVDDEGNVRFKEGPEGPGRIVGKMRSNQPQKALGFFALKYRQIGEK